jgi:hypothetical protein
MIGEIPACGSDVPPFIANFSPASAGLFGVPIMIDSLKVAHARAPHRDRTDAGHDLALGQMPVAHQPLRDTGRSARTG